jgi:RNA-directed DNA polymerase
MKLKSPRSYKKAVKPYELNQCAMFNTSSRLKLSNVLLQPLPDIFDSIGLYSRFQADPKPDPFSAKTSRKSRSVQKPKGKLLSIHSRILRLLKRVSVPSYMQAALAGTSYRKNAAMHASSDCVATIDIGSFFSATNKSKVFNFFESTLSCPSDIAVIYSDLVTCDDALPTGSPLSPLMSFYANKRLFDSLNELASRNDLIFTCYIDDLTFSGKSISGSFLWDVERLIHSVGHRVASGKKKLFKAGFPKHVTGVVLFDSEVSVPCSRYKKLRSIDAALEGRADRHDFSESELLNMKAGVLSEIAYLDPSKSFLARRAIDQLKKRKLKILGDGKLTSPNTPAPSLPIGETPPWDIQPSISTD